MPRSTRRRSRSLLAIACAASGAGITPEVLAQGSPPERILVRYSGTPSCPSKDGFLARVRTRTTRFQLAEAGEPARSVLIDLREEAHGAVGRVTLLDFAGHTLNREVNGDTCAEVADVLSLVVALSLDPYASLSPRVDGGAAPVVPDASPPAPPLRPPPIWQGPSPPQDPALLALPIPDTTPLPPPPARAPSAASRWSWALGAGIEAQVGKTPALLAAPTVFVGAFAAPTAWYSPAFRVAFERAVTGTGELAGGGVRFRGTFGQADVCLLGWRRPPVTVSPCLELEAGELDGAGSGIAHPRSGSAPWLAVGAAVPARMVVLGPLFIELRLALRGAVVAPRFFFAPDATIFDVPAVNGGLLGALGSSF